MHTFKLISASSIVFNDETEPYKKLGFKFMEIPRYSMITSAPEIKLSNIEDLLFIMKTVDKNVIVSNDDITILNDL